MPVDHYENFPVASVLLPARLRPAVEAIYAFARSADDIADEGNAGAEARLESLEQYERALDAIERGIPSDVPLLSRLAETITAHRLPLQPFRDLLSAFRQDIVTSRYANFGSLLDYCRRSANPVGCLMLHLYKAANATNLKESDAICTALQLINFWQDVTVDWQKNRIYLPAEDMSRYGVTEAHLAGGRADAAWHALMRFEVERARAIMLAGAPLALRMPGRIGWELRLIVQGGLRILECIEAIDYDVFRRRPQLKAGDWLRMTWRAVWMKYSLARTPRVG
ncbi:MAG TPA: squalene synthase HpnC [Noviherbaspirillum sp.]|uniref:squalene synthase HpnC n=1 Tax=Noviherbaspirillum sp. TaxID=1926288 RepID=UPI002B462B7A|nr:squalene synthase HpnC [Noviherbaspirillum sp.]HJV84898.1 squalene synthase HpnC [Noviherbaspirillum sp.]